MKRTLSPGSGSRLAAPLFPLLFLALSPLKGQEIKAWTNTSSTAPLAWSDSANWSNGESPVLSETSEIFINSLSRLQPEIRTIELDVSEQELRGGLRFQFTGWANLSTQIDLNGGRMTLNGGGLYFNGSMSAVTTRPAVTFSNGTFQLGTAQNASVLEVGKLIDGFASVADSALIFGSGAVFDSHNVSAIRVLSESVNYAQQFTLDLSEASVTTGSSAGVLTIGTLEAAAYNATAITAGRSRRATIELGAMNRLEITGDLQLGVSGITATNAATIFSGTLLFAKDQVQGLEVNVGRNLKVGVGIGGKGSLRDLPGQTALRIGRAEMEEHERGAIQIGFSHLAPTQASRAPAEGEVISDGGSFAAYVSELRIGENRSTVARGSASGTLDLSKATLSVLSITGEAVIGSGYQAEGRLLLHGGTASSDSLSIGEAIREEAGGRSLLRLDGTTWSVAGSFDLGAEGDVEILVGAQSAGLDFSSNAFSIASGGTITVTFSEAPGSEPLWALRFLGDQSALLIGYQSAIRVEGAYGSQAGIFYDGSYTYYGIQQIPEPKTTSLLLLSGLAVLYRYGKSPRSVTD